MRKDATFVVLLAVVLCVPALCRAQTTGPRKFVIGTDLASGDFSSETHESTSDASTDVYRTTSKSGYGSISPSLGVFLNDTLVAGSSVRFSFSHYSNDAANNDVPASTGNSHTLTFSVGPFLRKYFGNPQGRGMPFLHAEGGIGFETYSGTNTPVMGTPYGFDEKNYQTRYFELLAGYEMFITELLGLQYYGGYYYSSYGYDYVYSYPTEPDSTNHYKGHYNQAIFGIGLRVYLHGK